MKVSVEFDVKDLSELREVLVAGREHTLLDAKVVRFDIGKKLTPHIRKFADKYFATEQLSTDEAQAVNAFAAFCEQQERLS
ncbi:MAG: hypothetical protein GF334_05440 [Candidatus Altiarchaeales archaeon]|nr:hypothetical protein [Candidatus Altiarchaeales archaeon]